MAVRVADLNNFTFITETANAIDVITAVTNIAETKNASGVCGVVA